MDKYTQAGDLRLADLGYYKIDYLKQIDSKKAFLDKILFSLKEQFITTDDIKQSP